MAKMFEVACNWCCCHYFLTILIFIGIFYFIRRYFEGGQYNKQTKCKGKIILITGANCGKYQRELNRIYSNFLNTLQALGKKLHWS